MPENRDFAWLRKTLCDEIEAVRNGTADHTRAKSVAALAAAALKSVEVEAMVRQQHSDLGGLPDIPALGSTVLCAFEIPVFAPPVVEQKPPKAEPQAPLPRASEPQARTEHDITEVGGFKVGDRVECNNGHRGKITKVTTGGRIEVAEDTGGTFPYSARHLTHEVAQNEPARGMNPVVKPGPVPRFVAGRAGSGSE